MSEIQAKIAELEAEMARTRKCRHGRQAGARVKNDSGPQCAVGLFFAAINGTMEVCANTRHLFVFVEHT